MRINTAPETKSAKQKITYKCRSGFGMIDIHPAVEGLRTSEVPVGPYKSVRRDQQTPAGDTMVLKTHEFDCHGSVGENINA